MKNKYPSIVVSSFVPFPHGEYDLVISKRFRSKPTSRNEYALLVGRLHENAVYPTGVIAKVQNEVELPDYSFKVKLKISAIFDNVDFDGNNWIASGTVRQLHGAHKSIPKVVKSELIEAFLDWISLGAKSTSTEEVVPTCDEATNYSEMLTILGHHTSSPKRTSHKAGYKLRKEDFTEAELKSFTETIESRLDLLNRSESDEFISQLIATLKAETHDFTALNNN